MSAYVISVAPLFVSQRTERKVEANCSSSRLRLYTSNHVKTSFLQVGDALCLAPVRSGAISIEVSIHNVLDLDVLDVLDILDVEVVDLNEGVGSFRSLTRSRRTGGRFLCEVDDLDIGVILFVGRRASCILSFLVLYVVVYFEGFLGA